MIRLLVTALVACQTASSPRVPTVVQPGQGVTRAHPAGIGTVTELARGDNAFIGRLVLEPGAVIPPNTDDTEEFVVVLEGTGTTTIGGVTHDLAPGTTLYIPPGVEAGAVSGPAPLVVLQVFAGPRPADKYTTWPVVP